MEMRWKGSYKNAFVDLWKPAKAIRVYELDGGGPKDSENTLKSFLTTNKEKVFWQLGADMTHFSSIFVSILKCSHFHSLSGASWGGSKDYSVEVADKDVASSNAAASAQQQQYYLGANLKDPHQLVLMSPIKEISNMVGAGGPSPPASPSMGSRYT